MKILLAVGFLSLIGLSSFKIENKVTQDVTPPGKYISVKDYGAVANTPEDQTAAIQAAVNAALKGDVKTVYFPKGKYLVKPISIGAGITLWGYGATLQLQPMQGKWARLFNTYERGYLYKGDVDSPPLVIKGFTFDGNRLQQGPYKHHELEHQALLFISADPTSHGRLTANISDIHLNNAVGDGLATFRNINIVIKNVTANEVYRGGLQLDGGNNIINIDGYVSTGDDELTGLHSEPASNTYGASYITVNNLNIKSNFTILMLAGSKFVGTNIVAGSPWAVSCIEGSSVKISDSKFGGGNADARQLSNFVRPGNVVFNNVDIYADDLHTMPAGGMQYAVRVMMNNKWSAYQNQLLELDNCRIHLPKSGKPSWKITASYASGDQKSVNNLIKLNNTKFDDGFDVKVSPLTSYILK